VKALKTVLIINVTDPHFSASCPQAATANQEQLLAFGRYSLLLKMKAECEYFEGREFVEFSWLTLENATNSSPPSRCWVLDLAIGNYLIHSYLVEKAPIFALSDGGQKGQCLYGIAGAS
jgi:hypothetical protein